MIAEARAGMGGKVETVIIGKTGEETVAGAAAVNGQSSSSSSTPSPEKGK